MSEFKLLRQDDQHVIKTYSKDEIANFIERYYTHPMNVGDSREHTLSKIGENPHIFVYHAYVDVDDETRWMASIQGGGGYKSRKCRVSAVSFLPRDGHFVPWCMIEFPEMSLTGIIDITNLRECAEAWYLFGRL